MRFRPCIDLHAGKVKQIVGASIREDAQKGTPDVRENFVADRDACYYASYFAEAGLSGGHVVLLDKAGTSEYEASRKEALSVLQAFPGTWQIGGGITVDNAAQFLDAGASHCIVTSFVFQGGRVDEARLQQMMRAVGRQRLILDISCKRVRTDDRSKVYHIVTDRWTKISDTRLDHETIFRLKSFCDGFLVHAADVEGLKGGIEEDVLRILAGESDAQFTYAGGIHTMADIEKIRTFGIGKIDFTVGSALEIYGGDLKVADILAATVTKTKPLR